jgi:hypothetical protein
MGLARRVANAATTSEETWRRHANPWSVWTRFAAVPAMILAVWSRVWIGWWSLAPVAVVMIWLFWLNLRIFPPVTEPGSWAAKGVYGEKLWLRNLSRGSAEHQAIRRFLVVVGLAGFGFLIWGLVQLDFWPILYGATLVVLGKLWLIDRFGMLYDELNEDSERLDSAEPGPS